MTTEIEKNNYKADGIARMNTTDDANLQQTKDEGYGSKPG
jgi:hypothetical protein